GKRPIICPCAVGDRKLLLRSSRLDPDWLSGRTDMQSSLWPPRQLAVDAHRRRIAVERPSDEKTAGGRGRAPDACGEMVRISPYAEIERTVSGREAVDRRAPSGQPALREPTAQHQRLVGPAVPREHVERRTDEI